LKESRIMKLVSLRNNMSKESIYIQVSEISIDLIAVGISFLIQIHILGLTPTL
jgi:hypothetical protein